MTTLPAELKSVQYRLENDLPFFARNTLKIQTLDGTTAPFIFNRAQFYLHQRIEDQLNRIGKVRLFVLKGRKQGCSTYVAARYFHKTIMQRGNNVFILSHQAKTTDALFAIVRRYYNKLPPQIKPNPHPFSTREIGFPDLESSYATGTAGSPGVGRGTTIQLFHGSEPAHWGDPDAIRSGVIQAVPESPGTEIIQESTANGMDEFFYRGCMDALEGNSDYELVFIPWYWQEEYTRDTPPDDNEDLTPQEEELKKLYNLADGQIYWRRSKIAELKSEWLFKQEYPSFVQEAFQTSGTTLINPNRILAARKSTITDPHAPLILGVDPGRNRDRTVFAPRRGRELLPPKVLKFSETDHAQMEIAAHTVNYINDHQPTKVFIDVGHGYGTLDRLRELGYGDIAQGVHFGAKATEEEIYTNKRAEIWCKLRDYLHCEDGEVSCPDSDTIQKDLMSVPEPKRTVSGKIQLHSKDQIRQRFGLSPDIGDAYALTFSYPVHPVHRHHRPNRIRVKRGGQTHTLRALQRMDGGDRMDRNKTKRVFEYRKKS